MAASYRVKNWPRFAGVLLPWIALWQFRHERAMKRVLGPPWAGGRCQPWLPS
jgi:hypothetical protein